MIDSAQAEDKPMVESRTRDERIREAAYRRFLERGESGGYEATDWFEAEKEIAAEDEKTA